MKGLGLIIVLVFGFLMALAAVDFPNWGDPASPASTHVSPRYIEKAVEETAVPNVVTAVLADYRGFDTMFETTVIFAAGLACFVLLKIFGPAKPAERLYRHIPTGVVVHLKKGVRMQARAKDFEPIDGQWTPHDLIIKTACRILIPFMQLFALYVVAHGHHSPGGGFQGGIILGASLILLAISHDLRTARQRLSETANGVFASMGIIIYVGVGFICLALGANFLDYAALAVLLGVDSAAARSWGILFVEIGVAVAVMATMVLIYRNISSGGAGDEGL